MADFKIKQGTDGGVQWPLVYSDGSPLDLSGYTVRAQIKSRQGVLLHSFSTSIGNVLITGNSITLTWDHTETSGWRWKSGSYQIELVSPINYVSRIDEGYVELIPEVVV